MYNVRKKERMLIYLLQTVPFYEQYNTTAQFQGQWIIDEIQ
jgi:hypothetical protein